MISLKQFILPDSVKRFLQKHRNLFIMALVGLLFLIVPMPDKEHAKVTEKAELSFSVDEMEQKIEKMLKKSEGVGRVELILTLKSSAEQIYAEEARASHERQESENLVDYHEDNDKKPSVISRASGEEVPVLVKQIFPEYLGATVVCDGADNASVRRQISDAVSALTGITADKIAILKMKH